MLPLIDINKAAARRWDVIIAGSSFAAMFFLRGLPEGVSVLVVEKGAISTHAANLDAGDIPGKETFAQTNTSGKEKTWVAHTTFGGNSNCWWACTPRFHPSDFRMRSLYGVAEDWPFGYNLLERFYEEAEAVMEVAGGGSDHILPRRSAFPYPPHTPSRSDMVMRRRSADWFAQPAARSNGGSRAVCCANGVCTLCPIDSKFTIPNGIEAFARPGAAVLTGAEVRAVRIEGGRATGVALRQDGADREISGATVALGTNAVFNAAILLRSDIGLPGIGRGLNEQSSIMLAIDADGMGPFGGTSITGHGYPFYDGPHRARHSGVLLEIHNAPAAIRPERGKWLERVKMKLIVEDLPQDDNRVELHDDEPHLVWTGHHPYAQAGLDWGLNEVRRIVDPAANAFISDIQPSEAHILGTHRMGPDPARHVVDAGLRVHGVTGLFALGGGVFPSSSMANPTLTISALSLLAARGLA